jgi:hypothetical protein
MRSLKLSTQALGATVLLALALTLAPAVASAARGHRRLGVPTHAGTGGCRISLAPEQHTITSESVQLIGQLRCRAGTSVEGQTVTVFDRTVGSPAFTLLGTTVTKEKEDGFFSISDPSVKADTVFYAAALGARSPSTRVKVAPQVELTTPPTPADNSQLFTGKGHIVKFSGKVSPADKGAEVLLQRENAVGDELWNVIQRHIFVGEGGNFSFEHKFIVPGDANIRVVVRPNGLFTVRGLSTPISYQISQAQIPGFTIETLHDSIVPGEKTEIHGELAAGSGQKVTLYAHLRGQRPFKEVSAVTTGPEGAYSFPETPQQNTFYIVRGPGTTHSAVLFEGVRDVLTPSSSPSSVMQGQPITFTGTVSPAYKEEPVYLEHENLFGGGFHVIGTTRLSEEGTGTYSIFYEFIAPGRKVLRVRVPGNPANQGAVSAPFDVEVTPGPLSLVKPVPPSMLPGEGQV